MGVAMDAGPCADPLVWQPDAIRRIDAIRDRALKALSPATKTRFDGLVGDGGALFGVLARIADPSGISGTGDVAFVVGCIDGAVCLAWPKCGGIEAFASVADALECHGHGGQTWILWSDGTTSGRGGA